MMNTSCKIKGGDIKYGKSVVLSDDSPDDGIGNLETQKKNLQKEIDEMNKKITSLKNSYKEAEYQKENLLKDAQKEVENIKQQANQEADNILKEATMQRDKEFAKAQEEGHKQGFDAGYQEGSDKFINDFSNNISSLNALCNASFQVKSEIITSAQNDIIEMALLIAQKVTQIEFDKDSTAFKKMAKKAISLLKEQEDIKIVVNPKLIDYAKELSDELPNVFQNLDKIKIIKDKTVSADGVLVESLDSRIDARLSTEIEKIARILLIEEKKEDVLNDEIEEKIAEKIKDQDD